MSVPVVIIISLFVTLLHGASKPLNNAQRYMAALTDTNNVITPFASIGSQTDGYSGGLCSQIPHGGSSCKGAYHTGYFFEGVIDLSLYNNPVLTFDYSYVASGSASTSFYFDCNGNGYTTILSLSPQKPFRCPGFRGSEDYDYATVQLPSICKNNNNVKIRWDFTCTNGQSSCLWFGFKNILIVDTTDIVGVNGCIVKTQSPSETPTKAPTKVTDVPTITPTNNPSSTPTVTPTDNPSVTPTTSPTDVPTATPTVNPSTTPTESPSNTPTRTPTTTPSSTPTELPSITPTGTPSTTPTVSPTDVPTLSPTKGTENPVKSGTGGFIGSGTQNSSKIIHNPTFLIGFIIILVVIIACIGFVLFCYFYLRYKKDIEKEKINAIISLRSINMSPITSVSSNINKDNLHSIKDIDNQMAYLETMKQDLIKDGFISGLPNPRNTDINDDTLIQINNNLHHLNPDINNNHSNPAYPINTTNNNNGEGNDIYPNNDVNNIALPKQPEITDVYNDTNNGYVDDNFDDNDGNNDEDIYGSKWNETRQ